MDTFNFIDIMLVIASIAALYAFYSLHVLTNELEKSLKCNRKGWNSHDLIVLHKTINRLKHEQILRSKSHE